MQYIYTLALEDGCYYVGSTTNPEHRIHQHMEGSGTEWTRRHKFKEVQTMMRKRHAFEELTTTLELMKTHGAERVRGDIFTQMELSAQQLRLIEAMIRSDENRCFVCGSKQHFAYECTAESRSCARCGRNNHTEDKCYARTHLSGMRLAPTEQLPSPPVVITMDDETPAAPQPPSSGLSIIVGSAASVVRSTCTIS